MLAVAVELCGTITSDTSLTEEVIPNLYLSLYMYSAKYVSWMYRSNFIIGTGFLPAKKFDTLPWNGHQHCHLFASSPIMAILHHENLRSIIFIKNWTAKMHWKNKNNGSFLRAKIHLEPRWPLRYLTPNVVSSRESTEIYTMPKTKR